MSLHGDYDPQNIFAKILRGEAPCHRVFEDDRTLAFLDIFPQADGHALVLPKAAARNLLDLPDADLAHLFGVVRGVARAAVETFRPDGVMIVQYNGAPAGQTVFHAHVHVIPRYAGVDLSGHGRAGRADDATLNETAQKLGAACSKYLV